MSEPTELSIKPIHLKTEAELRVLIQRWLTTDAEAVVDYVLSTLKTRKEGVDWRDHLTEAAIEMAPLLETVAEEQAIERKNRKTSSFLEDFFGESTF